ncbi:MAG TPA: N-ethylammeline chlorohydrolase, partial [Clostridia bacterium]|nr:N-ethylammeline chlorohydrolase [Clostridia bacterium]
MDLLIRGAHIITGHKEGIYAGIGNIGIDKDLITYVGRDDMDAGRVIDAAGMIAMPGLFNAHTHSSMVLMRNITADKCLEDWLTGSI